MIISSVFRNHIEIVKILIDNGADKEKVNNYSCTPLIEAVIHTREEIIQYHITAGANVNSTLTRELSTSFDGQASFVLCKK